MTTQWKPILNKIGEILEATDPSSEAKLTELMDSSPQIFVGGAGRSRLVGSFFVMRLMHAGYKAFLLGEIVTPSIGKDDLLIVISGSGNTPSMVAAAQRAKKEGAKVALITAQKDSNVGDVADHIFQMGNPDIFAKKEPGMPMGTMFELSTLILLEGTIAHIIHEKGIPEEEMRSRHANLE